MLSYKANKGNSLPGDRWEIHTMNQRKIVFQGQRQVHFQQSV